jgi:hypothetical protein
MMLQPATSPLTPSAGQEWVPKGPPGSPVPPTQQPSVDHLRQLLQRLEALVVRNGGNRKVLGRKPQTANRRFDILGC